MRPVTASTTLMAQREDVYAFLDVLANHELFTDHFMKEWSCSGPETGVGGKATVVNVLGGRRETVELVVVDASPPHRSVERNVSAGGKRVAEGAYELTEPSPGLTHVVFTYTWLRAPLADRLLAPLARMMLGRAMRQAMRRLAEEIDRGGAAQVVRA